jgi:hypothetical protein
MQSPKVPELGTELAVLRILNAKDLIYPLGQTRCTCS